MNSLYLYYDGQKSSTSKRLLLQDYLRPMTLESSHNTIREHSLD